MLVIIVRRFILVYNKVEVWGVFACLCLKVRSDWFVYVVLSCLPWVGKELYEKKDVEMDRLLSQVEGYLK